MKLKNTLLFTLLALFISFSSCEVDQTQDGDLPEVDVDIDAESGQMPDYNVDWADVNVGTKTKTVKVPEVRVVMEEEEVEVPYIDIDMPNSNAEDKEEITLVAEAEVTGKMHELNIVEVLATSNLLYVIAELEETNKDLGDERVRVSDRLVLNAPDLNVKYYIIGERPEGSFNTQYSYVENRSELNDKLSKATSIYKK